MHLSVVCKDSEVSNLHGIAYKSCENCLKTTAYFIKLIDAQLLQVHVCMPYVEQYTSPKLFIVALARINLSCSAIAVLFVIASYADHSQQAERMLSSTEACSCQR